MRSVRHEPALSRVGIADRAEGPFGEHPSRERDERDHDEIGRQEGEPDAFQGRLVRDLGDLLRRQLGTEVEGGCQDGRETDVEAEHSPRCGAR